MFGPLRVMLVKELPDPLTKHGKAKVGQKALFDVLDPLQRRLAREGSANIVARARQCVPANARSTALSMLSTRVRAGCPGPPARSATDPKRHRRHPSTQRALANRPLNPLNASTLDREPP